MCFGRDLFRNWMKKKELITLLEDSLNEFPHEIDDIYRVGRLFSSLSNLDNERFEALSKLYDLTLYVELLHGDFVVLFHQFLASSFTYERKYAMAKLYPLANEGFKQLYGFVSEKTGQVKLSSNARWKALEQIEPLMTSNEMALYKDLYAAFEAAAAFGWWKEERDNETHLDADGIYKHRSAQIDENKAIQDALSFYKLLTQTTALCSKMTRRLFGPIVA